MSQIGSNSLPGDIVKLPILRPQADTPPEESTSCQPGLSQAELEEANRFYNDVRVRQEKTPTSKWLTTEDVLKQIGK